MKEIKISSITLRNWRGERERTTAFNPDGGTRICGDNGLGKSRHFDAFCWLLFGKDSQGRADYELRTYDKQHQTLHHCECSVEAVLTVDGEELTLKREWQEKWTKPRGQVAEVFKGNEAKFWWNGAPVLKGEYTKRVGEQIIDDGLFRMITNPHYFPMQMAWQQQRQALLDMAGSRSEAELAEGSEDFRKLLDELKGKPLSDFRREKAAKKKLLKDEADKIPTRIDEVEQGMPEAEDWDALEGEEAKLKKDIDDTDKQLCDRYERDRARDKECEAANNDIYACQAEQRSIERRERERAEAEADRRNEQRRGLEARLKRAHAELSEATIDRKRCEQRRASLEAGLRDIDGRLETLRKEWFGINATEYDAAQDTCPCCGQTLSEEQRNEARAKFAELKQERLRKNNATGQLTAEERKETERRIEEAKAEAEKLRQRVETAEAETERLNAELINTPLAKAEPRAVDTLPEWLEQEKKIGALRLKLAEMDMDGEQPSETDAAYTGQLCERKHRLEAEREALLKRTAKRGQIDKDTARIAELTKRGRELAEQIADVERMEYVAAQFSKKKVEDCERRINGMFSRVNFKLFDRTQDGNEYETCVPLVDGVPYPVANTASQINAGLDIINTLCKFHNVCAPIFIDGAESVNSYAETPSQMVFLEVTDDEELTVK